MSLWPKYTFKFNIQDADMAHPVRLIRLLIYYYFTHLVSKSSKNSNLFAISHGYMLIK